MELEKIFLEILNMSITAGCVILAVLAVRLLIRRLPKIYSYILWIIVGFRLLCPISFSSAFSFFNLDLFDGMAKEQELSYVTDAESGRAGQTDPAMIDSEKMAAAAIENSGVKEAVSDAAEGVTAMELRKLLPRIAAVIWVLGIGLLLIYTIAVLIRVKKKVATAVLLQGNVFECEGIYSPFVFGFLNPKIYIPFHLQEEEQKYILGHEKYHIQRKDHLVKAAAYLMAVVYWFHPLVWLSYYFMCQDMEMSCDEKVIRRLGNDVKQDYSRLLLSFATGKRQLAGPLQFGESNAGKRIKNVLKYKKAGIAAASLVVVLAAILCLVFATDGKSRNSLRVTRTDEMPVLSSLIPMEESVQHIYTLEDNIKSYLVYADIYYAGVYGGREIIACHDVSNDHENFDPMTSINITSENSETKVLIMYNTDVISRTGTFSIPEEAAMWAADVLWDDGKKREIVPEQPYIYEAKYIGGNGTKHLECFRCENLNKASTEEWDRCIDQECTTILLSFVFSEKLEQDLLKEYKNVNEAYDLRENGEEEKQPEGGTAPEGNSTENNEQSPLTLIQVMDRILEECWDTGKIDDYDTVVNELNPEDGNQEPDPEEGDREQNGDTEDRMVLLARSEDGQVAAYGFISPEYGSKGIIMDYMDEEGGHNHNYFEWRWSPDEIRPWIEKADLDQDGRDEVFFIYKSPYGERVIVFQTFETCHMEPYELEFETEIDSLVKTEIHKDSRTVDLLDAKTGNVLISGIFYGVGTQVEFSKMDYTSSIRFLYDKNSAKLFLLVRPGIIANNCGNIIFAEEEIAFLIRYSADTNGGHFILTDPSLYHGRAYAE